MSSFDRRSLILLPLALAACGFQPVYAPGGTGSALYGRVSVVAPSNRESYLLFRTLEDRLGRTDTPTWRLAVTPTVIQEGQAVTASGNITRFSVVGSVVYSLHRADDDSVVTSGNVQNFTGYSATGSAVETLAAESDAIERLMQLLADQIFARLLATAEVT